VVGIRQIGPRTLACDMRMTYVGTLDTNPDRDSAWIRAFRDLGVEVLTYSSTPRALTSGLAGKVYRRLHLGRANAAMQSQLIELVEREKPDWIHFRLPVEFDRRTLVALKRWGATLTQYFNDDPFSKSSPTGIHWKFRRALPSYDGHFVFRRHNVERYRRAGAGHVEHCPPFYDPRTHVAPDVTELIADAAFIGHYEADWRLECLDALARRFEIVLKGGGWDRPIRNRFVGKLAPITHAFGDEYNRIYASVIAGLCFFSKINNDTWTRRALEIVAVGGVLVCERTSEAELYFKDREEAFFFSSVEELIDIVADLKANPSKREEVRTAGYKRLISGPNTIDDRALQIVRYVQSGRRAR
jgi:spore maturation protein CgeB